MRNGVLAWLMVGVAWVAPAPAYAWAEPAAALPTDVRLAPVRADLIQLVDQAAQSGLPAEALVSKVQEGLAKNVPPQKILLVLRTLASDLAAARSFAAPLVAGRPSPALLRALCDAKAAGVKWNDTAVLVRTAGDGAPRALQTVTDL